MTSTNPATVPAQTDATIITALNGDISVLTPLGTGVAQVGHSSTSAVSHPVGLQPTGTFLTVQSIGDTTPTGTVTAGVVQPKTSTVPININAYHNLTVQPSLAGTARIGDYINETQPLSGTAAVKPGSTVAQTVSSDINVNVGNSLGLVSGTGLAQIGHFSPATNEWQVTGTTIVTPQTLAGAITVEVGTAAAKTAVGNTAPADISGAVPAAGALGNNNVLVDASGGGAARIGSQFASPLNGGTNKTETAQGDIWVRAGSHLKVAGGGTGADIGHGPYDFAAGPGTINPNDAVGGLGTVRNRVLGNTTIGASQNSPAEDTNIAPNYMVFDASAGPVLINSGYGGGGPGLNGDVGGQLRFFIPAQQNLTVVAAPKFNDSASNADATKVRSSDPSTIFQGNGGQDHENGFLPMSTTARYAFTGTGNFAFYFGKEATTSLTLPTFTDVDREQLLRDHLHSALGGGFNCTTGGGLLGSNPNGGGGGSGGQPGFFGVGYTSENAPGWYNNLMASGGAGAGGFGGGAGSAYGAGSSYGAFGGTGGTSNCQSGGTGASSGQTGGNTGGTGGFGAGAGYAAATPGAVTPVAAESTLAQTALPAPAGPGVPPVSLNPVVTVTPPASEPANSQYRQTGATPARALLPGSLAQAGGGVTIRR